MYSFYSDPGHGWLKVKIEELKKLNIADKITSYSYMKGDYAYLEEDCDLSTFLNAKFGENKEEKQKFMNDTNLLTSARTDSEIRIFANYKILTAEEEEKIHNISNALLHLFTRKSDQRKIKRAGLETLEYWNKTYNLGY